MRDPARIDKVLKEIKKIWKEFPDLRLGQLIGNCMNYSQIYYIEDEDFIKLLDAAYLPIISNKNKKK